VRSGTHRLHIHAHTKRDRETTLLTERERERERVPLQSFIRTTPKMWSRASAMLIGCPKALPGPTKTAFATVTIIKRNYGRGRGENHLEFEVEFFRGRVHRRLVALPKR
jgi:hypothetical protein